MDPWSGTALRDSQSPPGSGAPLAADPALVSLGPPGILLSWRAVTVGSQGLSRPKPKPLLWVMAGQLSELGPVSGNFHFVDVEKAAGRPSVVTVSSAWGRGSLRLATCPGPCPTWQALPGSRQARHWPEAWEPVGQAETGAWPGSAVQGAGECRGLRSALRGPGLSLMGLCSQRE